MGQRSIKPSLVIPEDQRVLYHTSWCSRYPIIKIRTKDHPNTIRAVFRFNSNRNTDCKGVD